MSTYSEPRPAGLGLAGWALVLPLLVAAVWVPARREDYVLAVVAGLVGLGAIVGHRMGAAKILGFFVGWAVGVYYAEPIAFELAPVVRTLTGAEGSLNRLIATGAAGIGASFLGGMVFHILTVLMTSGRPDLDVGNRRFGFLLGAAQGVCLVFMMLCGAMTIEPLARQRLDAKSSGDADRWGRQVAQNVVLVANRTRDTPLRPLVEQYNPFEKLECFQPVRQAMKLISDPQALEKIAKSSAMSDFASRPETKQVFDELARDPQIRQLMQGGQQLDAGSLASLMSNPQVMKFLEDPKIMAELGKLAP